MSVSCSHLSSGRENYAEASGRMLDADIASDSAELMRQKILLENASAILGQANVQGQIALSLPQAA